MTTKTNRKWKYGFKRWIVLGLLTTVFVLSFRFCPYKAIVPPNILIPEKSE
jgi:hypothetical protein